MAKKDDSVRKEDLCEGSPRAWSDGLKPQLHQADGVTLGGLSHLVETRTPKWASNRRLKQQHLLAFSHEGLDNKVEVPAERKV